MIVSTRYVWHAFGIFFLAALLLNDVESVLGDGPADNNPTSVRPIPPPGKPLPPEIQKQLDTAIEATQAEFDKVKSVESDIVRRWIVDAEVFLRGVKLTVELKQFNNENEGKAAIDFLAQAQERLKEIATAASDGSNKVETWKPSWTKRSGLVIGGFRSVLDGTVQPFGIVVPAGIEQDASRPRRLDVWLHGRDEQVNEVGFMLTRSKYPGEFVPKDTFVLHPWGRYSNAFRFAGEVDVFEAMKELKSRYRIDEDRISVRGFSMGGAGCWQMTVHYPHLWFAANPGAGFSETEKFLTSFQRETLNPPAFQRRLWNLYDCPPIVGNLKNVPTIAYSGEKDAQKQAADLMVDALSAEGVNLVHIIGKDAGHHFTPAAREEIERRMGILATQGRVQTPRSFDHTLTTLRYGESNWIRVTGLAEHWTPSRIQGTIHEDESLLFTTEGVTSFDVDIPPGGLPVGMSGAVVISVDDQLIDDTPLPNSDRSLKVSIRREADRWIVGSPEEGLRKRPGLQGPIDDAFLSRFIIVRPTTPGTTAVDTWVQKELDHAIHHWKIHFRGEAIVKNDVEITEEDIAQSNLILFGTRKSNKLISELLPKIENLSWDDSSVRVGSIAASSEQAALALVYPNPKAPSRYVVLNSGFTYRPYDYLNNARQTPKLPDWAIIDVKEGASARQPGTIIAADFFDERWKVKQ